MAAFSLSQLDLSHYVVDNVRMELYPPDAPCSFVALSVHGHGNCLYCSASLVATGDEEIVVTYYMYVCMYVCMCVAQLVRVCSWRLATSGTFGSEFECGRATYINSLGQGTNIQLPLSPECQFCPASMKYGV